MPNILKAGGKVHAAKNFINNFYDVGGTDRIYIGLGDHGAEWGTPAAPDTPLDSYDEEQDFWANLIGIGLVGSSGTDLVIPRKTWVSGSTYVVFNEATEVGSGTFDTALGRDFYICNTESDPKVYKLLTAGGGTSTAMPTHTIPEGATPAPTTEADGYQWAYLYTIGATADVKNTLLTTAWMPVPSGSEVQAYSNGLATAVGDLCMGDGTSGTYGEYYTDQIYQVQGTTGNTNNVSMAEDSNNTWVEWTGDHQLGAFWAGCSLVFPDYAGTGNIINNVAYRQLALLRNPKNSSGARLTAQWVGAGFEASATLTRGVVMTLDNRTTITRAVGQTETNRLILEF